MTLGSGSILKPRTSSGIIRLSSIVIHEHFPIASITEEGAAERPNIRRRFDPARSLHIKVTESLQFSILLFQGSIT